MREFLVWLGSGLMVSKYSVKTPAKGVGCLSLFVNDGEEHLNSQDEVTFTFWCLNMHIVVDHSRLALPGNYYWRDQKGPSHSSHLSPQMQNREGGIRILGPYSQQTTFGGQFWGDFLENCSQGAANLRSCWPWCRRIYLIRFTLVEALIVRRMEFRNTSRMCKRACTSPFPDILMLECRDAVLTPAVFHSTLTPQVTSFGLMASIPNLDF